MAMLVEYSRKKVVRDFLGGMASRKNLKKWIYLSGKTQRLNWRPLTHTVAYLRPPYVVMRQACHIPPDVVVDCWVSDSENGLHRHFLCRQDVWMTFVCHLSEEITSKISRTWYLPLHSVESGLLHFRQAPAVTIVEQETPLGTERVLTKITLGAAGRFAAFNDVVTLTVQAADGDECHGPFLPMRSYEDEAQCDMHLSPSPLLKHYPEINSFGTPPVIILQHPAGGGRRRCRPACRRDCGYRPRHRRR